MSNYFSNNKVIAWRVKTKDTYSGISVNLLTPNQSHLEYSTDGWVANSGITISLDGVQKWQGNNSLKTVTTTAGDNYAYSSFKFPVSPSLPYTFSAYLNITTALTGGNAHLKIVEYNSVGNIITSSTSTTKISTTNFERLAKTITTNANTTHIELRLQNTGVGTVWWDGIQFEQVNSPTTWVQGSWLESEWSDWVLFKTSAKPQVNIVYPNDNETIETEIPTFQHQFIDSEGLPQKSYQYKLYADDGSTLLWTSDLLVDYNNLIVCPKGLLQNNTYYKVDVTVVDADGLSNTSTKRRFYTNFPPTRSNTPDFTIAAENEFSRNKLKWVNIKSIPATYVGSGERYLPATFGNGIEIKELGEKLYWDIDIPAVFRVCGIFKPNVNNSGTIEYFYANSSNWMRFFYDEIGQKFIIEKCVNGEIRTTGSPATIFNAGQSAFYHIQQKNTGHVIVHTGIRGSGILSKWGDI